jgi:glutamate 5-kinase
MQQLKNIILKRNTVVIKIGTNLLADKTRGIDTTRIDSIASSVCSLRASGKNVAIVSSGAIGAGVAAIGLKERPRSIPAKQATAAIGQPLLMEAYEKAFRKYNQPIAQLLLTKDDFSNRARFVNARNTFAALFENGVVPIINENDTVAVEEIKLGDNDNLSAMVATLIEAAMLIILSDVDGLYTADPSRASHLHPRRGFPSCATRSLSTASAWEEFCPRGGRLCPLHCRRTRSRRRRGSRRL